MDTGVNGLEGHPLCVYGVAQWLWEVAVLPETSHASRCSALRTCLGEVTPPAPTAISTLPSPQVTFPEDYPQSVKHFLFITALGMLIGSATHKP